MLDTPTSSNQVKKISENLDNAQRQRLHVSRKQQTHFRLQCWVSQSHRERLAELAEQLEDNQASLLEQAIDLLYRQEIEAQGLQDEPANLAVIVE
ncbi:MAG: RepB family protein [Aeromonas sp.]